jgi:DNA processing protein
MVEPGRRGALSPEEEAELEALLHLRLLPRVGDRAADRLLRRFERARAAVAAPDEVLRELAGPAAVDARAAAGPAPARMAKEALARARELGLTVTGRGLPGYPGRLLHLADPPQVLFLKGRTELLGADGTAVVGTRRATGGGRRFAARLGRILAREGIPVISGLALGIDGAAHRGALEGGGPTVAVLGNGVDRAHPSSHARLQARIGEEGLLVSEFPPGEGAAPHHFPRRNRILAALARAVVVVEAGARSGALITVDHALDLGREVFAVPGSVEWEQSKGTNGLIRDGARVLVRPEEFLEGWEELVEPDGVRPGARSPEDPPPPATPDPEGILPHLGAAPRPLDEISTVLGRAPSRVLRALSELELAGAAILDEGGWRAARFEDDPRPEPRRFPRQGR